MSEKNQAISRWIHRGTRPGCTLLAARRTAGIPWRVWSSTPPATSLGTTHYGGNPAAASPAVVSFSSWTRQVKGLVFHSFDRTDGEPSFRSPTPRPSR